MIKKNNKIAIDCTNISSLDDFYFESAIAKIKNGVLSPLETEALIDAVTSDVTKSMSYMFALTQLLSTNKCECKCSKKKTNIFKKIWNKITRKNG